MMAKILITRAEPSASHSEQVLQDLGHEVAKFPVLEIKDTHQELSEKKIDGIILTSQNAIEVLKQRNWKPINRQVPIFCVGEKTAAAAKALGFNHIFSANGNAESLCELILENGVCDGSNLLYPCTVKPSHDFGRSLQPAGILVEATAIYEIHPIEVDRSAFLAALKTTENGFILVYSARSGEALANLSDGYDIKSAISRITVIAISDKAAQSVKHLPWKQIFTADSPNQNAMIDIIDTFS